MKLALIAGLATLLIPQAALAMNFTGRWKGQEADAIILDIHDDGTTVWGETLPPGSNHWISGTHASEIKVDISVTRRNSNTGCVTVMYGYWVLIGPSAFRWEITGTDGRCDLAANYQETRIFQRI